MISLLEGEITRSWPASRGGCIIHAGGGGGFHAPIDASALMCNRRRPAATSSRRASFSALASANSSCILHRAQQHHADASACQHWLRSPVLPSGIFVGKGFVGNGVITVMINSPWQADDDADNQSGDNRGDSAHTSISDRSARFNAESGRQPYAWTDHNQRPVKPRYCCNGRLPDGYHHDQS